MLVPETDNMSQLVHDNAKLVAIFANRDCLRSGASFTNE